MYLKMETMGFAEKKISSAELIKSFWFALGGYETGLSLTPK